MSCVVENAGGGGRDIYTSLYDFFVLIMMHINHAKCNSAFTQDQDTYVASRMSRMSRVRDVPDWALART